MIVKRLRTFLFLNIFVKRGVVTSDHSLIVTDNPTIVHIEQFIQSAVKITTVAFSSVQLLWKGPRPPYHLVVVKILLVQIHDLIDIFSHLFIDFIIVIFSVILIFFDQFISQIVDQVDCLSFFHFFINFCRRILNFGFRLSRWVFSEDFRSALNHTLLVL